MNDLLKKYIQDHREEFDTLEVPEETFGKIMSRLNEPTASAGETIPLFPWKKWIAAASVIIIFSVGSYTLWNQKESERRSIVSKEKRKTEDENFIKISKTKSESKTAKIMTTKQGNVSKALVNNNSTYLRKSINNQKSVQDNNSENKNDFEEKNAIELINNQYSASSRLQGIALIRNFSPSNEKLITILSEKALSDENTNVRLAAVEALSTHIENKEVNKSIRQVFLSQDDPFVQKELIAILTEKNPSKLKREIETKLKELTLDPTTAVFVRDEAYAVLMKY